jgi:hypothetical protein
MKFLSAFWDREGRENAHNDIPKRSSITMMGFRPARTDLKLSVQQMYLSKSLAVSFGLKEADEPVSLETMKEARDL